MKLRDILCEIYFNLPSYVEQNYDPWYIQNDFIDHYHDPALQYLVKHSGYDPYYIVEGGEIFNSNKFVFADRSNNSVVIQMKYYPDTKVTLIPFIEASTSGTGMGRKLIELLKDFVDKDGGSLVAMKVTNKPFWERMGFELNSENNNYIYSSK